MKLYFTQLFVRFAVASAFLSAVADRWGYWGKPRDINVSWGNWGNFLSYSDKLNFFVPEQVGSFLAISATILETVLAILLIIGYRTKISAILSGILLLFFAISMTFSFGIKSTFTYSVWIGASACFLLSNLSFYSYSLDNYLLKRIKNTAVNQKQTEF